MKKRIRFSQEYPKLQKEEFTTIRKNTKYYILGETYKIITPKHKFIARIQCLRKAGKELITEEFAKQDADCSAEELIKTLEKRYGEKYNDFIIITLKKKAR